ncbi:AsmA family protein [uncultured Cohaesibacter sp.]|uniref:AsmA family protein n=1 Tax=uncultured Cohaesibacter sp. TaxID=1002546 RepID=UPI002931794F|nr:AsmA family protein [uncultured Cohaesibacter sp.]
MRNIIISLLSTIFLILLALVFLPFFLSTDYLKTQVEDFVKKQSGMTLDIGGDVSLSFITGVKLSAEAVSLEDKQNKPIFSVERLDFGLALSPLLSGKADVTGIALTRPLFTISQASDTLPQTGGQQGKEPPSASTNVSTSKDTPATTADGQDDEIDLSALSLRQILVSDAMIVSVDEGGHSTTLASNLDANIRIPDFAALAELEISFTYRGNKLTLDGTLDNPANAINKRRARFELDVSAEALRLKAIGDVDLGSEQWLVANYAANSSNVTQLLSWLDVGSDVLDIGTASLEGSLLAQNDEIRLPSLSLSLDKQTVKAAARIFTSSKLARPFVRLALLGSVLNFDEILPKTSGQQSKKSASIAPVANRSLIAAHAQTITETLKSQQAGSTTPDLSVLTRFDGTLDLRSGRVVYQGKSIRQLKLLAQLIDGQLDLDIKSANLAKGNIKANVKGNINQLVWTGTLNARELDLTEIAALAGQKSPLLGQISTDVNFAAQGLDAKTILAKGNLAGILSLSKGELAPEILKAANLNGKNDKPSNISGRITIANLDDPVDISGNLKWRGEAIRFASTVGLGEALNGTAIPASVSLDSKPLSILLAGKFDPNKLSLTGSKLTVNTKSSKNLLAWLGQKVNSGTPDMPVRFSTNLALDSQTSNLTNLSLVMGQSKGAGNITYKAGSIPTITGKLAFDKLDVTPLMGVGTSQGRTTSASASSSKAKATPGKSSKTATQSSSTSWDNSPIDFSGLNTVNADFTISTKSLIARDIVTGAVNLKTTLQNGKLASSLTKLNLYKGTGNGEVTIDATSKPEKMTAKFDFANLDMKPFLTDSISLDALSGRGKTSINMKSQGSSQLALIKALNGTANIEMSDGQINGINIPQMLRSLQSNILEGWSSSKAQSTDFSALTASFKITNGIAANSDLSILSPLFRLSGEGSIDLPQQRIDYKTTPKVVSKLRGQGGPVNTKGVPIPIIIKGKLAKPRIYPDIKGILENPQAILEGLNEMGSAGKAASKGVKKLEKTVNKELKKQSEKLGIDLNKIIQLPTQNNNKKNQSLEQQLLKGITKGLF